MDQLKAYSPKHDQLYFTMRFIDGLRHDIKLVMLVQRPKDLDTAATLALLQEEVASASPSKPPRAGDWHTGRFAQANKGPLPLSLPPRQDKALSVAEAREPSSSMTDSKLAAIKSVECNHCQVKISCARF